MEFTAISYRLSRMVKAVETTIIAQLDILQQEFDNNTIDQSTYDFCRILLEADLKELQVKANISIKIGHKTDVVPPFKFNSN
ncbi:hypothetical protein [Adhaeribacter pallidiroseus]|uniref:Uncharacterized protein n=1 Tax=Adhaeribacter pallidiroseus TaxID=2072847 RepID=A0A369QP30_9BACT|nr:hypothetical protein [Adhaeribacter pallidiroseus]RDC65036.1 hypothetical protein AHMF7616_03659 [Adhaeribacter pallidiroseus]